MFYVYALVDPRSNQPFYIGKGKGSRASHHLNRKSEQANITKHDMINEIISSGYDVEIKYLLYDITSEKDAYELETMLILAYGRRGKEENGCLTNIKTKGWTDCSGMSWWNNGARSIRSHTSPGFGWQQGMHSLPWSAGLTKESHEGINRISIAKTGKSNPMAGKKMPSKSIEKREVTRKAKGYSPQNKSACQIEIDGESFSGYEVVRSKLGLSETTIRFRCNSSEYPTWKMKNLRPNSSRSVIIDGDVYPSVTAASKTLSISWSTIRDRLLSPHYPEYQFQ